jgi:monoterpene epsilon-lactone hydrolase
MSPWTDLALTGESMSTRADVDLMIKPDGMRESAATYLAGRATPGADRQPQFGVLPREDVFPDEDIFCQNT